MVRMDKGYPEQHPCAHPATDVPATQKNGPLNAGKHPGRTGAVNDTPRQMKPPRRGLIVSRPFI
jgi:hypothetical protein